MPFALSIDGMRCPSSSGPAVNLAVLFVGIIIAALGAGSRMTDINTHKQVGPGATTPL